MKSDLTDESGMIVYLTTNKRTNNAGVFMVGQDYLELPPGEEMITVEGACTSDMSSIRMSGPVKFTRGINHMHYLGIKSVTILFNFLNISTDNTFKNVHTNLPFNS